MKGAIPEGQAVASFWGARACCCPSSDRHVHCGVKAGPSLAGGRGRPGQAMPEPYISPSEEEEKARPDEAALASY